MAFTPKTWQDSPSATTPISAAALIDLERRVTNVGLGGVTTQTTVGGSYSAVAGDIVVVNPASGGFTVNLPAAAQSSTVTVVAGAHISASNLVTTSFTSTKIFGPSLSTTGVSSFPMGQPGAITQLASDGTNWYTISGGPSAGMVVGGGSTNIATSESRTNVAYGTLTTPDQVTGIVLPTNGLIAVWYQATWQESVSNAARAAIFLGGIQIKAIQSGQTPAPVQQAAYTGSTTTAINIPLFSHAGGLGSNAGTTSNGLSDLTTGQTVGMTTAGISGTGAGQLAQEIGGSLVTSQAGASNAMPFGGPCYLFAAAGTYVVNVQFKASSGSVTASNRKLWVQAMAFS